MNNSTQPRPIYQIAADIRKEWQKPYFGAVPYLDAMSALTYLENSYYFDDGPTIVNYFLSNASTFRGPKAKALKNELRAQLRTAR